MYENLSEEQLAAAVENAIGLKFASALNAIQSQDPDLGRSWAEALLQRESKHEAAQARLDQHLQVLRTVH
jgi:hypothetical protein